MIRSVEFLGLAIVLETFGSSGFSIERVHHSDMASGTYTPLPRTTNVEHGAPKKAHKEGKRDGPRVLLSSSR